MARSNESVRSIPTTNQIRDHELRRILDAIVQVVRYLEARGATTVARAEDWRGANVGDGVRILADKRGEVWPFRALRVTGPGLSIQENGDTILLKLVIGGSAGVQDRLVAADGDDESPGTLAEKLIAYGTDTGAVELLAGVEGGALGLRKLLADGAFVKIAVTEGGAVQVVWNGEDVSGYDDGESQVAGHAEGAPTLFDVTTEIGETGSDASLPTEQAVRELFDSLSDAGGTTAATVVSAVRYDTSTKKFQAKTRTITVPTAWLGTESAWTDVFTASTFACPTP